MNLLDIFQNISIIVLILGGISGIVWTSRKGKKELKQQDININAGAIDSSKDALEIVTMSTKQVLELKKEIAEAEVRMKADRETLTATYTKQIKDLQAEVAQLKCEAAEEKFRNQNEISELLVRVTEVEDWAQRLSFQVKSLGGDPVPLKVKKAAK